MTVVCVRPPLVRICDLAGRRRGIGFLADDLGTVVTSHEAVDGLGRAVLHAGRAATLVAACDITPVPEWDLALVRTTGLDTVVAPQVIATGRAHPTEEAWLLTEDGPLAATLETPTTATYTSTARYHALGHVLRLRVPASVGARLRLSADASGAPVVNAATGAVLGVLGTALQSPDGAGALAVPLHPAGARTPGGPLGTLLRRNGACAPGFGPDLNLAGVLRLARASVGPAVERSAHAVPRPPVADMLDGFLRGAAGVVAVTGDPGSGRTTELAALAARCTRGPAPTPAVWLRGADLRAGDTGLRDAVARALTAVGRTVAAPARTGGERPTGAAEEDSADGGPPHRTVGGAEAPDAAGHPRDRDPDTVAHIARAAGRPLLVLLDAPEEMPPHLAHRLRSWTLRTAGWLRASGARLVLACRPEFWEQTAGLFPVDMLHPTGDAAGCLSLGALPPPQAARARAAYGLPDGALCPADEGHPLAMRMLARIRAAQVAGAPVGERPPPRHEIFSGFLDLLSLCVAQRLAARQGAGGGAVTHMKTNAPARTDIPAGAGPDGMPGEHRDATAGPDPHGAAGTEPARAGDGVQAGDEARAGGETHAVGAARGAEQGPRLPHPAAVRRLAARVSGQLHEAARRCLGSGQGELSRADFEELFPWHGGWASAVLAEGALTPAGEGYRFVDEEFADWLQGSHLELDAALDALVHRRTRDGTVPVPRHRIGPVVQALLLCDRRDGAGALTPRLLRLVDALGSDGAAEQDDDEAEAAWWAAHLLHETLLRTPDARPYVPVLRALAAHVTRRPRGDNHGADGFGPGFWRRVPLGAADKAELLRLLLPADPPADTAGGRRRFLDVLAELLPAEPGTLQPLLCRWFDDRRPLRPRRDTPGGSVPTVATAAQALLYVHRKRAVDALCEALVSAAHPYADELLAELVHAEPSALCRAVHRWAHDARDARAAAAAHHGVRAARRATSAGDRELLRHAAFALLRRPARPALHDAALAVLVRDPAERSRHLEAALRRFTATGDAELAAALGTALPTHPEPVLAAFRDLLTQPAFPEAQAQAVHALARLRTPALARRAADLVRQHATLRPWRAGDDVAAYLAIRLRHGNAARAVLRPLVADLLRDQPPAVRERLARVLAAGHGPLRDELLELLLADETEPSVLEAARRECRAPHAVPGPRHEPGRRQPPYPARSTWRETVRRPGQRASANAPGAAPRGRVLAAVPSQRRQVPGEAPPRDRPATGP